MDGTDFVVSIDADTSGFDRALDTLAQSSQRFGSILTGALLILALTLVFGLAVGAWIWLTGGAT